MFDSKILIEMLTVQNNLNRAMGGNAWLLSDNTSRAYYRAAWVEGAEAIGHYGYKWWKKFDRQAGIGQTKLEVVDMLHFVLSDELRSTCAMWVENESTRLRYDEQGMLTDECVAELIEATAERIIIGGVVDLPDASIGEETFILVAEQFVAQAILRRRVQIRFWGALADSLNLTMEHAALWYLGKAALNFLRDSNGQKEGTYVKTWWGKEDNVYLEAFIGALLASPIAPANVFETITEHLQEQYRRLMVGEPAL